MPEKQELQGTTWKSLYIRSDDLPHPVFIALLTIAPALSRPPSVLLSAFSPWPGSYLIVTVPFISCFLGLYRNHTCMSAPTFEEESTQGSKLGVLIGLALSRC